MGWGDRNMVGHGLMLNVGGTEVAKFAVLAGRSLKGGCLREFAQI